MAFLDDRPSLPLKLAVSTDLQPKRLILGNGSNALEVAICESTSSPTAGSLRHAWKTRLDSRATPLLLVTLYNGRAALCGPAGDPPPTLSDLEPGKVEQLCAAALDEPNRNAALRFLNTVIQDIEKPLFGFRNEGLFALHALRQVKPEHSEWWKPAEERARPLLSFNGQELIRKLGFSVEQLPGSAYLLRTQDTRIAVAVFLERGESADAPNSRFGGLSAVSYAFEKADRESLRYVIVSAGQSLRLYPVEPGIGVGRRGRTETYIEARLNLIPDSDAAYLWLLFSAEALQKGGTVEEILEDSKRYAEELGRNLRERIYEFVVPSLAEGLLEARKLRSPNVHDLEQTYEMALLVLFRLLFIAYAEDKDLLPIGTNDVYQRRSLKRKALDLIRARYDKIDFGKHGTHWAEVKLLWHAVDQGNREWGIPPYNGGLFSSTSELGKELERVNLPDFIFGEALFQLLVANTSEGFGPVDFRSLGVREFGTIYEGLLESELSLAETDLALEGKGEERQYRPAKPKDEVVVAKGRAYLHSTSGARKSTGTYFTKRFAVEHLLERALDPVLEEHAARLDAIKDDRSAADAFFDLRVADIAMGSGHFLVAAVDHIERAMSNYLVRRNLPQVINELARLRAAAKKALGDLADGFEIEDTLLLRRQIARRCIYGVDINPTAVELARLAIWIHTFVPGLPLSFLDRNLVRGNSLVGIATVEEANNWLKEIAAPLWALSTDKLLGQARTSLSRFARASDADAAEIKEAREAADSAHDAIEPAEALFDILAAARVSADLRASVGEWARSRQEFEQKLKRLPKSKLHKDALACLGTIPPFHFPAAFPEVFLRSRAGFDVIVGNPPWQKAQVEEHEFWSRYFPGLKAASQAERQRVYASVKRSRPDLVDKLEKERSENHSLRILLMTGPYPGMGDSHADLYKAFCWRFWDLIVAEGGRFAVVLPREVLSARGSTEFRLKAFEQSREIEATTLLNSRGWVFDDAEYRYTIALIVLERNRSKETLVYVRGPFSDFARYKLGVVKKVRPFSGLDVPGWSDTASIPLLPRDDSLEVFEQLRRAPRLDRDDRNSWKVRVKQGDVNATLSMRRGLITTSAGKGFWPVYKGESFDLWLPDSGSYFAWADPEKISEHLFRERAASGRRRNSPFSEFSPEWFRVRKSLPCLSPRIVFRDSSRATDTRTVRVALIPSRVVVAHQAYYILLLRGLASDEAFLLGVLSSLPLDWYARRFVEKHVSKFLFDTFPVPQAEATSKLRRRVISLAGRLASEDGRFEEWSEKVGVECGKLDPDEKQDMIHELDAVVGHLYGLTDKQLAHIFETFHEGWDYQKDLDATLKHFKRTATNL